MTPTSSSTTQPPRRRRSSSVAFAAAAATVGLALCAAVADAFLPAGGPVPHAARSSRALSTSSSSSPSTPLAPLAAVGSVDPQPVNGEKGWLPKIPNSCDSDFECEGTESCCDFLFFKMCCSDGMTQEQWVPVPIPVRPGDGYRGGYGGGYGNGGGYYR